MLLRFWLHLLKKSLMENFIFVQYYLFTFRKNYYVYLHLSSVRHFCSSSSSQRPYLEYADFLHFLTYFYVFVMKFYVTKFFDISLSRLLKHLEYQNGF